MSIERPAAQPPIEPIVTSEPNMVSTLPLESSEAVEPAQRPGQDAGSSADPPNSPNSQGQLHAPDASAPTAAIRGAPGPSSGIMSHLGAGPRQGSSASASAAPRRVPLNSPWVKYGVNHGLLDPDQLEDLDERHVKMQGSPRGSWYRTF